MRYPAVRLRSIFAPILLGLFLLGGCAAEVIDTDPMPEDLRNRVSVQDIDILFRARDEPYDLYLEPDEALRDRLSAALHQRLDSATGATPVALQLVVRKYHRMSAGEDYVRSGWYHLTADLTVLDPATGESLGEYEIIEEYGVPVLLSPFVSNMDHEQRLTDGVAGAVARLLRHG
ncbi:MAG: hypothetical protein RIM72_14075 [Alphaproteobacteria bacterium]